MKTTLSFLRSLVAIAAIAALTSGCTDVAPVTPDGDSGLDRYTPMKVRPIEDFLLAQGGVAGTGMGASLGVSGGAITWIDRSNDVAVVVDYAGSIFRREARWAAPASVWQEPISTDPDVVSISLEPVPVEPPKMVPPVFSGRVLEQMLPDGSARVIVDLYTSGALVFAGAGGGETFEKMLFGATSYRDPAARFGASRLYLVYRAPYVGAPVPWLVQLIYNPQPGQKLEQIYFHADATTDLPPALSPMSALTVDFKAYDVNGSLGMFGSLSEAHVTMQ